MPSNVKNLNSTSPEKLFARIAEFERAGWVATSHWTERVYHWWSYSVVYFVEMQDLKQLSDATIAQKKKADEVKKAMQ